METHARTVIISGEDDEHVICRRNYGMLVVATVATSRVGATVLQQERGMDRFAAVNSNKVAIVFRTETWERDNDIVLPPVDQPANVQVVVVIIRIIW